MTLNDQRSVGPWRLGIRLGKGGNATVWEASRPPSKARVALKVLNTTKVQREPYRRFVREVEFMKSIGTFSGVLPLLDAYMPDKPSKDDKPWLAMPIATPITQALESESLESVVTALADIAGTLVRLRAEYDAAHRDLKPGNLYMMEGKSLVGDFGLVAVPSLDELTKSGRPLGPLHFAPYEMVASPSTADPFPADVFSLAKTLWVLATQQSFPPQGHQPAETPRLSIADLRPNHHARQLDLVVDDHGFRRAGAGPPRGGLVPAPVPARPVRRSARMEAAQADGDGVFEAVARACSLSGSAPIA